MEKKQTVAFHTLGCKLNFSETSTISRIMEKEGFEKRDFTDLADVYVINTCSVTDNADKECRQLVRRIQRKSPESFVVITGCYAQLKPKEIASIPGVDLVLGAAEKFNIAEVNPLGEKFDPNKHQAISMLESDAEPNSVITVLQKGYTLNERVLRPALVMVAKAK